jgi:hypothetical protein
MKSLFEAIKQAVSPIALIDATNMKEALRMLDEFAAKHS